MTNLIQTYRLIFLALFFVISMPVFSQVTKESKANELYEKGEYKQAASFYLKVLVETSQTIPIYTRLADCYLKIGDYKNAEVWYEKLYSEGKATTADIYNYTTVLKKNNKQLLADDVIQKLQSENKTAWSEYDGKEGVLEFENKENVDTTSMKNNDYHFYKLKGIVLDKETNLPLAETNVVFKSVKGRIQLTTKEDGSYEFEGEDTLNYVLSWNKAGFYGDSMKIKKGWVYENSAKGFNLELEKDLGIRLVFIASDFKTGELVENAKYMLIYQPSFKEFIRGATNNMGQFKKPIYDAKVGDKYEFAVKLEKDGYVAKTFRIKGNYVQGDKLFDVKLSPVLVPKTIKKPVKKPVSKTVVKPIVNSTKAK